ncbi:ATP-dependent Clp protease adaptor ClpS [Bradyrhizobium retamae]|uniref:ATP-dependent Clp protease adaptor ClpS n=1 Tax=Bradyrhizobium retamae TaxID=1300035 RepID=UPI000A4F6A66|nr:ATP-dependent Clp protease adaptor ClpS [Bradyrhizobium retamae]
MYPWRFSDRLTRLAACVLFLFFGNAYADFPFMHDICTDAGSITLFIHNDDNTPVEFVRQLLRNVFGKSERDAIAFTALIEQKEKVACGPIRVRSPRRCWVRHGKASAPPVMVC